MRDLIERQVAIDALMEILDRPNHAEFLYTDEICRVLGSLPSAQPENQVHLCDSCRYIYPECPSEKGDVIFGNGKGNDNICACNKYEPSAQPNLGKYEYHYDHTDCIWYRPEARNRCPVTCAQYRDGWNDAMNYIFRDGKGYMPYRRDKQYGE